MGCNSSMVTSYNQLVPESKQPGFTAVFRKKGTKQLKWTPHPQIQTLNDLINRTYKEKGEFKGLGQVIVRTVTDQNGKEQQQRSIEQYTYKDVYERAMKLGKSLYYRKLYFKESVHQLKFIGIYSKNRLQWFITDWACLLFGLTSVPLYDTLGAQNMSYCLNQTQLTTLFASGATLKELIKLTNIGKLKTIISYDSFQPQIKSFCQKHHLNMITFSQLINEGQTLKDVNNSFLKVKPDDCYTFSYTSGTTGPPKGAMLSHRNILSFICSIEDHVDTKLIPEEVYLSYLPLPHIMERCVVMAIFYNGTPLIVSSGDMLKLKDDCALVKPTIFVSVPRIYNRIVDAVKSKFAAEQGIKKMLIDSAVESKLQTARSEGTVTHFIYDSLVFSKVRAGFGGKLRLMASGSAPISPQVHAFMKSIMCCPLIQAYGQTESSASILYTRAYDKDYGVLSQISGSAEIKLCDIPQMKYTSEDRDQKGQISPRGEIWVRGPQIFLGYYKQPDQTKDTITQDGWLKTGDIGQIIPGTFAFKIIDRKKNIFKLQQGEYVAPDKVEGIYSKCKLLAELFLHGDSSQHFAVLVAVPNKQNLLKFAGEKHIEGTYEQLCVNQQIRRLVLSLLINIGKSDGLHGFEQAKNIYLQPESFAAKGILTNTLKLIRYEARTHYKQEISNLYKQGELNLGQK